jgi:hypothetical protein
VNGDNVHCVLSSNATCASATTASSNTLQMTIKPILTPAITIWDSVGSSACAQKQVKIYSAITPAGIFATRMWMVNGAGSSNTSPMLSIFSLKNGDTVTCRLTNNNTQCLLHDTVYSNPIIMTILPAVSATVTVTANPGTNITSGAKVTFTAAATNQGSAPSYQWTKNGFFVGTDSDTFSTSNLANLDVIRVEMTSSDSCALNKKVNSAPLTMRVSTGIDHAGDLVSDFSLYPNPNTGQFRLKGSLVEIDARSIAIDVTSMLGKTVFLDIIPVKGSKLDHAVTLPASVANGIYFLRISGGGQTMVSRFTVDR